MSASENFLKVEKLEDYFVDERRFGNSDHEFLFIIKTSTSSGNNEESYK